MKTYLSLIKFSHTIFALPFAMVGYFLGIHSEGNRFDLKMLILVLLCMVFARSAAMAFNRYLDRDIDLKNPRTANREIPAGIIRPNSALLFVLINSIFFVLTTWFINLLCFLLSPVALLIILGYSYTKRFTWLCHFVLGLGLALAPIGAYLAVTGHFALIPILYALVVLFWVGGFDIIYALQDEDFDKTNELYSMPAYLGKTKALTVSNLVHLCCGILLLVAGWQMEKTYSETGLLYWLGAAIFLGLLIYQHLIVKPHDLRKVNLAFATTNGIASVLFGSLLILDFYW